MIFPSPFMKHVIHNYSVISHEEYITFQLSAIKIHFDVPVQAFIVILEENLHKSSLLSNVMVNKFN
jgi:hypothetical protein